jgi:hypothetical protein
VRHRCFRTDPEDGLFVHAEMQRALSSSVMESEMRSLYLFTPIPSLSRPVEIQWPVFRDYIDFMSEPDLKAFSLIGVAPFVANRLALCGGLLLETTSSEAALARTY